MKIFDKIKNKLKKKEQPKQVVNAKTPKEIATEKGETWVQVIDTQINPESPSEGYFELDWNELFIKMLAENGYNGKTEADIIDLWFNDLCRTIAAQEVAQDSFVADADIIKLSDIQKEKQDKENKKE